ncbi:fatty acid hydroxylase [Komagataeibacter rhaeticus]|uniref:sterol desaturase family protein n=1 Tax=Komagataeibacter rhaeticus TaxID=215221 RepID=UPI000690433D|nr:sterol desaturase family protein [Komagataeibacter rhaeticus]MBL7240750.1 sterol desaturase family protein [Komagataeibacter rhaeticus]MDT8871189.1 sterol desaturase family protein [Komagataeibacter rhaeticus]PYD53550.1 fatty acid hydroxylase [Komagataeibacter rhaeticus]
MRRVGRNETDDMPIRLFKNPVFECMTLLSFPIFLVVWGMILFIALLYAFSHASSVTAFVICFLIGWVVWFPMEYLLHRFLFHLKGTSTFVKSMVFLIHGNHHEQPNHPLRNLMPLSVSLPLAAVIWTGCVWFMGKGNGSAAAAGFICGYIGYDIIHYSCHQFPMKSKWLKKLKVHHIKHHYKDHDANYAITGIFIDGIFKTSSKQK